LTLASDNARISALIEIYDLPINMKIIRVGVGAYHCPSFFSTLNKRQLLQTRLNSTIK